jgi:FHA domain-containing protein
MSRGPVRPQGAAEVARVARAAIEHPYVAWRDADGALQVHELSPRAPVTIGRVDGTVTFPGQREISREHAEVTVREHADPPALCVYLLDLASKHGTEHRTVRLRDGVARETGPWQTAPRVPGRPAQLDEGEHDVRLAHERYVLIGGVPLDEGSTSDRDSLPEPTVRQRDVLRELCRPFFAAPGTVAATPSNAEIAARLKPAISPDRVSDLLSEMYRRYELHGTKEQNRMQLVELAKRHLLDAGDYA